MAASQTGISPPLPAPEQGKLAGPWCQRQFHLLFQPCTQWGAQGKDSEEGSAAPPGSLALPSQLWPSWQVPP